MQNIFENITDESVSKMKLCFHAVTRHYKAGTVIMNYESTPKMAGIVLSGSASLVKYDDDGTMNMIEQLTPGSIFGEIFVRPLNNSDFIVECTEDCSILLFADHHLTHQCACACEHHAQLLDNLVRIMSAKTTELLTRIDILGHRSVRGKLMSYFQYLKKMNHSKTFTLPFPLYMLADYLFVDRSAMLREMKKMREDRLIESRGRKITVL